MARLGSDPEPAATKHRIRSKKGASAFSISVESLAPGLSHSGSFTGKTRRFRQARRHSPGAPAVVRLLLVFLIADDRVAAETDAETALTVSFDIHAPQTAGCRT